METVIINQIKKQSYTMKESLRALKTSISFSGKGIKSILFTSSVPNEGKSTVVMDLARSMADSKKAVLIVDTDMRKSVLVGRLRAQVESGGTIYGLSHYLSGQVSLDNIVYATTIPRVFHSALPVCIITYPFYFISKQLQSVFIYSSTSPLKTSCQKSI